MNLLLLGAPGSGKGTLSEKLVSDYNFVHVSTGNIFRNVIDNQLEYADELNSYLSKGLLVPDELTNKIVENHLKKLCEEKKSIVLDGYPRTINQAHFLENILNLDKVILIDVSEEEIIKRLSGRRICSCCKKIYNIYSMPSKVENVCDIDGCQLTTRKDDEISIIKDRLQVYEKNTKPLIDFYQSKLVVLTNNSSKEEIDKKIKSFLE